MHSGPLRFPVQVEYRSCRRGAACVTGNDVHRQGIGPAQLSHLTSGERELINASFEEVIHAPAHAIDIPTWCFFLSEDEFKACSPDHIAIGFTTALDGRRLSIQVAKLGSGLLVHHYVEEVNRADYLLLRSDSELFTPAGVTALEIEWELSVTAIDHRKSTFFNRIAVRATDEFILYLDASNVSFREAWLWHRRYLISHSQSRTGNWRQVWSEPRFDR
jgi:hypothetical protein